MVGPVGSEKALDSPKAMIAMIDKEQDNAYILLKN